MIMGKILALDYGETRIGVAISDEEKKYVFGRGAIESLSKQSSLEAIKKICEEEMIEKVILGLPQTMKGKESDQTLKTIKFGEQLKRFLGLPLEMIDERMTSKMAHTLIKGTKNKSRGAIDQLAAKIILEDYLSAAKIKK